MLIQGAGGGVGVVAVQLARAAGSAVIGTGRAWARELVGELGAGSFVDVERERFEDVVGQVDLVFDLVGGEVLERSWTVLKPGGVLVSVVEDPNDSAPARRSDAPGKYYTFNRQTKKLALLFDENPNLSKFQLATKRPLIIKTRDGLEMVSYLTTPRGVDPKKLPLVLLIHGGPWDRDARAGARSDRAPARDRARG